MQNRSQYLGLLEVGYYVIRLLFELLLEVVMILGKVFLYLFKEH